KCKSSGAFLSTESKIIVYDYFTKKENLDKFDKAWADCRNALKKIDSFCSPAVATSDLVKFNELKFGESIQINEITAKILEIAKADFELTNGLFDPTVYPLVDLWGFTPRFSEFGYTPTTPYDRVRNDDGSFDLPDEKYIDAFVKLVDFSKITLTFDEKSGYTLTKNIPDIVVDGKTYSAKLDLGGIAKGYAIEQMNVILRGYGYQYGYISCGSSSMSLFKSYTPNSTSDENYNLGVNKPRDGADPTSSIYAKIKMKDMSLSSSGDYEHSYSIDGKNYCHIIDPRSGYPINISPKSADQPQVGIATITLLGGAADTDDGLTTALSLMSLDELMSFIDTKLSDRMYMLVLFKQGETKFEVVTNIDNSLLTFVDDAYVLSSKIENGKVIYTGEYLK
ncbi:MAG: FAD:protein FMN transferase, partial [Clostridia bacterium]